MTRATNYIHRFNATHSEAGPRAKAARKTCAICGTGIGSRKLYCGPCSDVKRQQNHAAIVRRRRHKAKQLLAMTTIIQSGAMRDTVAPFASAPEVLGGSTAGADAVVSRGEGA